MIGNAEFGDSPGHSFRGNQWTGGGYSTEERAARRERISKMSPEEKATAAGTVRLPGDAPPPKPPTPKQREAADRRAEREAYGPVRSIGDHANMAERRVKEAAADLGMSEDEVANDVYHAYIDLEVPPSQRDDVRRALGIDRRYPEPSLYDD